MPARRGPRPDQLAQNGATDGQILTAGPVFPAFEDAGAGTARQQIISGETITTDQAISTPLDFAPINDGAVKLYLNGVLQRQGTNADYMISSTSSQTLIWLAGTGTAVSTSTLDIWIVVYES